MSFTQLYDEGFLNLLYQNIKQETESLWIQKCKKSGAQPTDITVINRLPFSWPNDVSGQYRGIVLISKVTLNAHLWDKQLMHGCDTIECTRTSWLLVAQITVARTAIIFCW